MTPTDGPICAKPGQYTVVGDHGTLLVDGESGHVLQYEPDNNSDEYKDIVRFDVVEYCQYNGEMDDTDILLIGYWTDSGFYEPPVVEERQRRGDEITARYKKETKCQELSGQKLYRS